MSHTPVWLQETYTYYEFKSLSRKALKLPTTFQWDLYFGSQKINGNMKVDDDRTSQNLKAAFTGTGTYELRCVWTSKGLPDGSATASIRITVT